MTEQQFYKAYDICQDIYALKEMKELAHIELWPHSYNNPYRVKSEMLERDFRDFLNTEIKKLKDELEKI